MLSVFALLIFAKIGIVLSAPKVTCDAPPVSKGDPASITCFFNEDVSETKKNIKVQRRPFNTAKFDPDVVDTVVDCYWLTANDIKCTTGDGFELLERVGRKAIVEISHAFDQHEGKYTCEIVPSDPSEIEACDFHVLDVRIVTVPVPGQCQEKPCGGIAAIIVICVFILVGVIAVVLLIIFRERLMYCLPAKCAPPALRQKVSKETNSEIGFCIDTQDGTEKENLLKSPDEESTAVPPVDISLLVDGCQSIDKSTQTGDHMAEKLHLTLGEKITRERHEVERRLTEEDAREKLQEIRKKTQEARRGEEEENSRMEREGRVLSKKERNKRTRDEDQRIKEEAEADEKLKKIVKQNQLARQKLEDEDWVRLNKAKRLEAKKRSSTRGDAKQ